jgi:hypothetical protein
MSNEFYYFGRKFSPNGSVISRLISAYVDRVYGLKFKTESYLTIKSILNLQRTQDTIVDRFVRPLGPSFVSCFYSFFFHPPSRLSLPVSLLSFPSSSLPFIPSFVLYLDKFSLNFSCYSSTSLLIFLPPFFGVGESQCEATLWSMEIPFYLF